MANPKQARTESNPLNLLRLSWKPLIWVASLLLVGYTLYLAPLADIGKILGNLRFWQIILLALVNLGILIVFGFRWWWLLRSLGFSIPYTDIMRYRLAAFGISYFTPGPQFGGEPLQVYYLRKYHQLPTSEALTSLSLDKLLELLANFSFLLIGFVVILAEGQLSFEDNTLLLMLVIILASVPWAYLLLLYRDKKIITHLGHRMPSKMANHTKFQRVLNTLRRSEAQMARYCQQQPVTLIGLMLVSGMVWAALVYEYWLALNFLGTNLDLTTTLFFIVAARLAFLTPLPGGLGALEFSQTFTAQYLGLGSELGAGIGLIIRARDIFFGISGLAWGGILTRKF
jgi:glycosyltransferase 2 family protein